jgi:hypothetical protein
MAKIPDDGRGASQRMPASLKATTARRRNDKPASYPTFDPMSAENAI